MSKPTRLPISLIDEISNRWRSFGDVLSTPPSRQRHHEATVAMISTASESDIST
jgi:hypothetical protein